MRVGRSGRAGTPLPSKYKLIEKETSVLQITMAGLTTFATVR